MAIECLKCHSDNPDDTVYCGKCATPLKLSENIPARTETIETPKEELATGSTFAGRYQIIEELGRGGMGRIYKATDTKIKEKVALKLIKPEIASDKKTLERFSNELRIARKIAHRNVGKMFDINEEDGTHYITMEYVSGQDLKGLIRQTGQLAIGTTITITKQVCEGLSEAHKTGVIHRDLKPSNIMIDREGNVRIMDFGIARSLKEKGITGAGVMIGTPDYMSPEQAEAKDLDLRSDIYSLGVILYEMVTGRVPFEGDTALSIAMMHKGETPKDPKEYNAQIPDDLSKLILKCLEKDKDSRYQSAGEIQSELENIEKGVPTTAREIPRTKSLTERDITVQFSLKKLFIPALVVIAIVITGVIIWQLLPEKEAVPLASAKPSIAVLPFEDLSPDKDQEYFCDGMAIELINRLTNIERLRVSARTSAFSFKGKGLDIREIGEKLGVENVLEGSIRKAGNKLRITVQLVNVADGYPLWSEKYERDEEDIFGLQDEISLSIIDKMKLKLLGGEREKLVKLHTENLEAYDSYLKGLYFFNKRGEGIRKGMEYFEQAIENDPTYALAYIGLADSYILLAFYGFLPPKNAIPKAKALAERALEMDDTLAEVHTSLAMISYVYEWDWPSAERGCKKAIELNPGYASAHHFYGLYLMSVGRFTEAMTEMKRALELDPLSIRLQTELGQFFNWLGRSDEAIGQLQKTLEMDPNSGYVYLHFGHSYYLKGMYKEAIAAYQKGIKLSGGSAQVMGFLGNAYAKSGQRAKAMNVLRELEERSEQEYVPKTSIARIYQDLGEIDKAFEWYEKAYEERDPVMAMLIKTHPAFENIRSDPRYTALLKKMGLE